MLKKITISLLIFALSGAISAGAVSANSENPIEIIDSYEFEDVTEEEKIEAVKEEIKKKYNLESTEGLKITRADEESPSLIKPRYSQTPVGEAIKTVNLGAAGGQLKEGVTFQYGGTIYWTEGGGTTSVSFSIGGAGYSIGVSIGNKSAGVTAYGMNCPAGVKTKMGVQKKIKFTRWHCEGLVNGSTYINEYINTQVALNIYFYNCA